MFSRLALIHFFFNISQNVYVNLIKCVTAFQIKPKKRKKKRSLKIIPLTFRVENDIYFRTAPCFLIQSVFSCAKYLPSLDI